MTTLYALATGHVRAAVAIVRISGPAADETLSRLTRKPLPAARYAVVRRLLSLKGELLDEALVLRCPGPKSFTGEDIVELHLHGGRAVVESVLQALNDLGLFPAEPGAFSRRAFMNGRLSLAEAEGIADLIDAETDAQKLQAMDQFSGHLDRQFSQWRDILIKALAQLEAMVDFPDEDLPDQLNSGFFNSLDHLRKTWRQCLSDHRGDTIRDGFRVALIGLPNAGKSSLFNRFIGREAAIVTPVAGTTRDVIESSIVTSGHLLVLADTAGLRETRNRIESEGVLRAKAWAETAHLRFWVLDPLASFSRAKLAVADLLKPEDWVIVTRSDLLGPRLEKMKKTLQQKCGERNVFCLDTSSSQDIQALKSALTDHLAKHLAGGGLSPLTRLRHRQLLAAALDCLERILEKTTACPELWVEDIRLAARHLESFSGRIDAEMVLDTVFASFCIGK